MSPVKVKICGICNEDDARAAERLGASYIGMILTQGFGRSLVTDEAVTIAAAVDVPVVAVLVNESVDEATRIARLMGAQVIQLHGDESPDYVRMLRSAGDWAIWKAVRARRLGEVTQALSDYSGVVEGLLVDAWHPDRPGGAGVSFSWEEFSGCAESFPADTQMIAAGGLNPDNVGRAVSVLSPDVVDVSSGVEGALRSKDHERIEAFIRNARNAMNVMNDREQA